MPPTAASSILYCHKAILLVDYYLPKGGQQRLFIIDPILRNLRNQKTAELFEHPSLHGFVPKGQRGLP
jgi:hypothetical protein